AVRQAYQQKAKKIKLREQEEYNPKAWIAASVLSILMIWFAVGVFQVFPTVILTGSMEPVLFPGDVALMLKCDVADIKTGDVIQYWTGEYFIVHRVMAIDENGFFQTKGDNNSAADANLVSPEQVRGKMIGSVPKLGKLTILLNSKREVPVQEVEF
ncbi:MAG: signal peptidase I, partial [Firmicutes bacterium]|nr:signal peptidase I [Bacillota bacterium]